MVLYASIHLTVMNHTVCGLECTAHECLFPGGGNPNLSVKRQRRYLESPSDPFTSSVLFS